MGALTHSLAVDRSSVPDGDEDDQLFFLINCVYDPVVAYVQAKLVLEFTVQSLSKVWPLA